MTLLAAVALLAVAADPPRLPPLDAKEWKPVGTEGLKVWDVKEGAGEPAKAGDALRVHYTGWTTDGKVFDSSRPRNASATFDLGRLIEGWKQGVPGLKPGGIRRLLIPAALGYKDVAKPKIPANSTLVFEVESLGDPLKLPDLNGKEWMAGAEGLKVWDVAVGSGGEVKPGDTVTIHYTGWTLDGTVFDSSVQRNEPATFPLGNLIRGWQIGIPGMKEGGIRRLVIPSAIGYGDEGSPPKIPGGATLVFDIEVRKASR